MKNLLQESFESRIKYFGNLHTKDRGLRNLHTNNHGPLKSTYQRQRWTGEGELEDKS
uniref:Uncharacterized protein n=1 Tax=Megaselia scalaris TaxID=36166 RepID=T1H2W8_MEGSC